MTIKARIEDEYGNKGEITLDEVNERLKRIEKIKVKNGVEKEIPIDELLRDVWEAIEWLRDIKTVKYIVNKYPLFFKVTKWMFSTGLVLQIIRWVIDYKEWLWNLLSK